MFCLAKNWLASTLIGVVFFTMSPAGTAETRTHRYIVKLAGDSVVAAIKRGTIAVPRLAAGRLEWGSEVAVSYLERLEVEHEAFRSALATAVPEARIDHEYKVLFNGLTVAGVDRARLLGLPGVVAVRRADTIVSRPVLDESLGMISAIEIWETVGGSKHAGEDLRIAIIDSGIDIENPLFDPSGFTMPPGYPLGATEHTTAKVIAARAYFRSDDPVDTILDEANPRDHIGHGSHCAGIAAGNHPTLLDINGTPLQVSGVAPRAYLLNYKVFYRAESGSEDAYDPELMAAFEHAVTDGADVISCSWGGPDLLLDQAPSTEVYLAALAAGVVVVFAAGNEGSGPGTVAYPGTLPGVLAVGSFNTGRSFAGVLDVTGPGPVPEDLLNLPAVKGTISPSFADEPVGPVPLVSAKIAGMGLSDFGCEPFPYAAFDGSAALIERGNCYFSDKVDNAYLAGAIAVVVYNNIADESPVTMGGDDVDIPAIQLSNAHGVDLEKWVVNNPGATVLIRDIWEPYIRHEEVALISGFSGRGPSDTPLAKPEIAAPGRLILSAGADPVGEQGLAWSLKQGTSIAAPHVAGAAAVLRQLYPEWSSETIRAALVGSASSEHEAASVEIDYDPLAIGAGYLDLAQTAEIGIVAEPPLVSFGEGPPQSYFEDSVYLRDLGWSGGDTTISWEHFDDACEPTVEPPEGSVVQLDSEFVAAVGCTASAPPGEYTGRLLIGDGTQQIGVPYHLRINPVQDRDLLLLDISFLQSEQTLLIGIYATMADDADLDFEVYRVNAENGAPPLADLLPFKSVLAFTGNDQVGHKGTLGLHTLDALSSYARKGGNVILAGQGALRDTDHNRIHGILGAAMDDGFPLIDPDTLDLVDLASFQVTTIGDAQLIDAPLDIGPSGDGQGNLTLVGELLTVHGPGLPELWVEPFLMLEADVFEWGGYLGMLFDPYRGHGTFPEAEVVRHRTAVMGFGFERIGSGVTENTSRQDFFEALVEWVSETIDLTLSVQTTGPHVELNLATTGADPVVYEVDFGDGQGNVTTDYHVVHYEYDELGTYEITALVRASLGAVDVDRATVTLTEIPLQPPDTDSDDQPDQWPASISPRTRDCMCLATGAGKGSLLDVVWDAL